MADFFEVAAARESCRDYTDTPVTKEELAGLAEAARLSPSACNSQPWHFVAVYTPDICQKVAACTQSMGMNKFASKAPAFLVVLEGEGNLSAKMGGKIKHQDYTSVDIGIAAAHIVLAAKASRLDTCILGWFEEDKLREVLSLAKGRRIRLVICVGHGKGGTPRVKQRRPLEDILEFRE